LSGFDILGPGSAVSACLVKVADDFQASRERCVRARGSSSKAKVRAAGGITSDRPKQGPQEKLFMCSVFVLDIGPFI
jgi:hypothetical protein